MIVSYTRVFAVGGGHHKLEIFEGYTDELGCTKLIDTKTSTRMPECFEGVTLPKAQKEAVMALMRQKEDGIILEDGRYKRY